MARKGRKIGYRSPNTRKCKPILENLYLMGFSQYKALEELHHQGQRLSSQTVHRIYKELEQQYPEAIMKYGAK